MMVPPVWIISISLILSGSIVFGDVLRENNEIDAEIDVTSLSSDDHTRSRRNAAPPSWAHSAADRTKCTNITSYHTAPATEVDTRDRLDSLRRAMSNNGLMNKNGPIEAYIIPSEDAHQSEYTADYDKRRQYISGFSGSAGVAVVTRYKAALWTDGRYFLQADQQLDCSWILVKYAPSIAQWLNSELTRGGRVGVDPTLYTWNAWNRLSKSLRNGIKLISIQKNLIDAIWPVKERSYEPNSTIITMPQRLTGMSWWNKTSKIRKMMKNAEVDAMVLTDLTDIAWLFNLRGADVPFNPVFMSYAIIEMNRVRLFIKHKTERLSNPNLRWHLGLVNPDGYCPNIAESKCVEVVDYNRALNEIDRVETLPGINKIWVSPKSNYAIVNSILEHKRYLLDTPVALMKSVKNPTERRGMAEAHVKDAIALIQFLTKLEREVKEGKYWTELSAANVLEKYRREQPDNKGLSFGTISAAGPHGAIIHYTPTNITDREITNKEMYLLDSGGQYLEGTTDVTRTFHYGEPTPWEIETYTRVLMGSINVAMAVWPVGTLGRELDIKAREPLWSVGLDYRHGTGHGIGAYLSVHEGPIWIGSGVSQGGDDNALMEGMFLSDEPGYYEDGKFGIRLETILMVTKAKTKHNFGGDRYLTWEPITLVPFEPNLINYSMLSQDQRKWLNYYNERCLSVIGNELKRQGHLDAYEWLRLRTKKISEAAIFNNSNNFRAKWTFIVGMIVTIVLSM
ncbi:xaa-Pro aminopeptidase 1-like [Tubulanus polymorphus]|uniref:xaa-Pro aminopeptidase 1-like n=1 Tax=Tubulanus polymorphus TaxID=672921 RepID=UPI003DA58E0F